LPRALQGSSHFGDDVIDGTQLSKDLLENEVLMTKDVGNCIVFDETSAFIAAGWCAVANDLCFRSFSIFTIRSR